MVEINTRLKSWACPTSASMASTSTESQSHQGDDEQESSAARRSVRPDGSLRSFKRVREGYVPPDELPKYKAPRPGPLLLGTLIKWNELLGWGFIKPDDLSASLFVYRSDFDDDTEPVKGGVVQYVWKAASEGEQSNRAVHVRMVVRSTSGSQPASGKCRSKTSFVPRSVAARKAGATPTPARRPKPPGEALVLGHDWYPR